MMRSSVQPLINEIRQQFLHDLEQVQTTLELEQLKVKFLGKKGSLQSLMKGLKDVEPDQRPLVGKFINELKEFMSNYCDELEHQLIAKEENAQLAHETIDVTLPGRQRFVGRKHPLTQAMDQIIHILSKMGFSVQYGPDIDTDYYNFEILNFPPEHPARDMQDTFYISPHVLLRTHTSNIQARAMELNRPPIRIIAPGKVYRNETITARSHVFFHQVEAVYIDQHVSFADLFATLDEFLKKLFKQTIETRYRPSYFPFVEPGLEVDISCLVCEGKGCQLCKHTGWVEVAGAGMIHPEVLKNGGIDPEHYSGFAWGMGLERLVMMLRGIQDIRLFTENDLRFLQQFTLL
ncbi:Phenylalanine--tRNA ligase alpha subunit [Candidatus Protochlamydia amoebophila]|uniref:Phenylalanine--tRNA ligase alpha subunit n=2 Tax=Candidatus Protochlamydia amoebophila TaxID=362787 RepID=A0A0C1JZI1_9BACT|nr:Phenylalanine--tRNA ligase alpha subunit [Candidatus Protochlamydia amoebophila]